jgi:hypothetical protein
VPSVRPGTITEVAPVVVAVPPAGSDVTVYPVIGLPPLDGAVHETVAVVSPALADTPVGAAGAVGFAGANENAIND